MWQSICPERALPLTLHYYILTPNHETRTSQAHTQQQSFNPDTIFSLSINSLLVDLYLHHPRPDLSLKPGRRWRWRKCLARSGRFMTGTFLSQSTIVLILSAFTGRSMQMQIFIVTTRDRICHGDTLAECLVLLLSLCAEIRISVYLQVQVDVHCVHCAPNS